MAKRAIKAKAGKAKAGKSKTGKARAAKSKTAMAKADNGGAAGVGAEGVKSAVTDLIYQSCLLMDEMKFSDFFDLCADDFQYQITAYSPEARTDMLWMDEDKTSMKRMLEVLPRHNSDHAPLTRHATVYKVDYDPKKKEAAVVSALQVFRTELDGGATELFAVAKIHDVIRLNGKGAQLASRNVRLTTRELGLGSHIPL